MYAIILTVAAVATVAVQTYKVFDVQGKQGQAKAVATQAMTYSGALQKYIDNNYNTLVFLEKTTITPQLLRDKGLLKSWFPDANAYGEPYTTEVIAKPTPSGKVILEAVIGIGSDKISQDMNRYLALATGSAMAGQTINGKMYGNNGTYTMDATKDLSKYGNVQIVVKSLGNAMQDIKLAPAIESVTNIGSGAAGAYIMPTVPAPVYPPACPGGVCAPGSVVTVDPVTHVVTVTPPPVAPDCLSDPTLPGCPVTPPPPTSCIPGIDCPVAPTPCVGAGCVTGGSTPTGNATVVDANALILAMYEATYGVGHTANIDLYSAYGTNALAVLTGNGSIIKNSDGTITIRDPDLIASTASSQAWIDAQTLGTLYGQDEVNTGFDATLLSAASGGAAGTTGYFKDVVSALPTTTTVANGWGNTNGWGDSMIIANTVETQQNAVEAAVNSVNNLTLLYAGTSDTQRKELIELTVNQVASQAVAFSTGASSLSAAGSGSNTVVQGTGIGGTNITYTDAISWVNSNSGATAEQAKAAAVAAGMDADSAAALVSVMQKTGAL
jgi:hypothetical protein